MPINSHSEHLMTGTDWEKHKKRSHLTYIMTFKLNYWSGENRLTLRLQTVSVFKMYDRYISQIGRDRRIAITLPGTVVLVSATTYQNKRLAPIHRRVTADRLPNGRRFSRDAHGILSRVVLLSVFYCLAAFDVRQIVKGTIRQFALLRRIFSL